MSFKKKVVMQGFGILVGEKETVRKNMNRTEIIRTWSRIHKLPVKFIKTHTDSIFTLEAGYRYGIEEIIKKHKCVDWNRIKRIYEGR